MPSNIDPIALIQAAKHRAYAYKAPSASTGVLGQDYTPSILQGRNITQNPAAAAAMAAQGVKGANTPQVAGRPPSPLNSVEPTANGETLPGFADGGQVIGDTTKLLKSLLARFGPAAVPTANDDAHLALLRKLQNGSVTGGDQKQLISNLANQQVPRTAPLSTTATNAMLDPNSLAQGLRTRIIDPRHLDGLRGQDPTLDHLISGYTTAAVNGNVTDDLRSALANKLQSIGDASQAPVASPAPQAPQMAEGGNVDNSSLKWIADTARKLGIPSYAADRARLATGVAKQLYGLDEKGNPVFGGRAWLSSQHGTPPRILDELTSTPQRLSDLFQALNSGKNNSALVTPAERSEMERPIPRMQWSDDASNRLDALDKRVKEVTGVGDPHSFPEHLEDAAAMLATPIPATKALEEAPMARRVLEYLTPVRPTSAGRYATDATALGGMGYGLDELTQRLAAHKASLPPEETDPGFEQDAMDATNAPHMAGGGSTRREILGKLAALAGTVAAGPVVKTLVKDAPDVVKSEVPTVAKGTKQMGPDQIGRRYFPLVHEQGEDLKNALDNQLNGDWNVSSKDLPAIRVVHAEPLGPSPEIPGYQHTRVTLEAPQHILDSIQPPEEVGGYPHPQEPGWEKWAVHPSEVANPHPVHMAIQSIKDEAFGPSDEPNWNYLDTAIKNLPGGKKVAPHYQAMKDTFMNFEEPRMTLDVAPEEQDDMDDKVNRFHQALDDLSAEHGVPIAKDPNAE